MVGAVFGFYFFGFLVTSVLAFIFFGKIDRLKILRAGYLLLVPGILSVGSAPSLPWLMLALSMCGLASGLLYSTGLSIVSNSVNTQRNFGGMLATQQTVAMVLIYALPVWVLPNYGYQAVWTCLAATIALLALSLIGFENVSKAHSTTQASPAKSIRLELSYLFFHFCLISAVWAFLERLGGRAWIRRRKHSHRISAIAGRWGLGCTRGHFLRGSRLGKRLPHALSTILLVGIFISFITSTDWLAFLSSVVLFSFGWSYCLAYQMASIGDLSDRYAVLIPGVQGSAAMIAPVLGGWIITTSGFNGLMLSAAAIVLVTGFGFVLSSGRTPLEYPVQ